MDLSEQLKWHQKQLQAGMYMHILYMQCNIKLQTICLFGTLFELLILKNIAAKLATYVASYYEKLANSYQLTCYK